jgi:hypothetical protein
LIPTLAIKVSVVLVVKLEDLDASHLTISTGNGSNGLFDFCLQFDNAVGTLVDASSDTLLEL